MSEIVASSNSTDKSDIVENLKRRLAILCCNSILNPPLEFVGALRIHADDTDEEKEAKREEHKAKTEKREEERKRREPELMEEMSNIMKRIYDSRREPLPEDGGDYDFGAMRENKTKTFGNGAAGSLPTYLCEICKNTQEENFFIDTTSGDTICLGVNRSGCGNVIAEHLINRGAEKRNFEGEDDRNHFGPSPDKLMTDSENMRTGMAIAAGNPLGGAEGQLLKKFSQASAEIEMNLSKIGHDERRTRVGYKTKHKKRAFELIDHMAANFGIHHQVIMRARQEFSRYRDVRETIQQFEGVVAACIVIAFREIMSSAGIEGVQAKKVAYKSQEEPLSAFKTHVLDDEAGLGPDSTIGRWTTEEMKRWLECMLGGSASPDTDAFIRFICAHVDKKLTEQNDDSSRKRKYPEMKKLIGFGTTTIESRKNILERTLRPPTGAKSAATTARAAQQTEKRAGQLLLNLDIATLHDEYLQSKSTSGNGSAENADEEKSKDVDLVRTLRSAIHRRVQFEAARTVSRHEAELEATRLLTERANGVLSVQSVTDNGKLTSDSGSGSFDRHHYMTEPVTSAVSSSNNSGAANQLTSSTKKRKMEAVGPAFSLPAEVVDMDSLFEMSSDIVAAAEKIQERQIKVEPKQPVSSVPKPKSRFKVVRQRSGDSAVNIGMDSEAVVVSAAQKEKESDIQQSAPTGSTHPSQVGQQLSREAMAAMLQFKQQRAAAAAAAAATNGQR